MLLTRNNPWGCRRLYMWRAHLLPFPGILKSMKVAEDRPPSDKQSGDRPTAGKRSQGSRGKRKVRVPQNAGLVRFFLHPAGKILLASIVLLLIAGLGVFIHFYNVYSKMIDERLRGGPYSTTARIFAAPGSISVRRPDFALRTRRGSAPRRLQRKPQQSGRAPIPSRPIPSTSSPAPTPTSIRSPPRSSSRSGKITPHRFPARQHRPAAL